MYPHLPRAEVKLARVRAVQQHAARDGPDVHPRVPQVVRANGVKGLEVAQVHLAVHETLELEVAHVRRRRRRVDHDGLARPVPHPGSLVLFDPFGPLVRRRPVVVDRRRTYPNARELRGDVVRPLLLFSPSGFEAVASFFFLEKVNFFLGRSSAVASATVFFRWSTAAVHARESYAGRKYDASATDRSMAMTSAWSASSAALRSSAGLASGVPTADRCEFTSPSTRAFRSSKPARNDRMFSLGSAAASNSALRASASALRASSMAARRSCGGAGLWGERSVRAV